MSGLVKRQDGFRKLEFYLQARVNHESLFEAAREVLDVLNEIKTPTRLIWALAVPRWGQPRRGSDNA
jgi:hypothetical protein